MHVTRTSALLLISSDMHQSVFACMTLLLHVLKQIKGVEEGTSENDRAGEVC